MWRRSKVHTSHAGTARAVAKKFCAGLPAAAAFVLCLLCTLFPAAVVGDVFIYEANPLPTVSLRADGLCWLDASNRGITVLNPNRDMLAPINYLASKCGNGNYIEAADLSGNQLHSIELLAAWVGSASSGSRFRYLNLSGNPFTAAELIGTINPGASPATNPSCTLPSGLPCSPTCPAGSYCACPIGCGGGAGGAGGFTASAVFGTNLTLDVSGILLSSFPSNAFQNVGLAKLIMRRCGLSGVTSSTFTGATIVELDLSYNSGFVLPQGAANSVSGLHTLDLRFTGYATEQRKNVNGRQSARILNK
jgi:hypothetical protein